MTRVTRGFVAKRRRKSVRKKTFDTSINGGFRLSKQKFIKAGRASYKDRKTKKRQFRTLWISRINAFLQSVIFANHGNSEGTGDANKHDDCDSSVSVSTEGNWFAKARSKAQANLTYSRFIHVLKQNQIVLNRKVLSQLACVAPRTMYNIVAFCYIKTD